MGGGSSKSGAQRVGTSNRATARASRQRSTAYRPQPARATTNMGGGNEGRYNRNGQRVG